MARLILIPTPIGNLEDITLRSIRILGSADVIFSEDTRVTKRLLAHLNITNTIFSFHSQNEHRLLDRVIEKIQEVETAVLVSDAGTPGISDPGFLLVRACIEANIPVECLPGPTAFVPALVASGLPCDKFVFEGFLPHKKGRQTRLILLSQESRTIILYESPHRLVKCLGQIVEYFGADRKICVCREISKFYEEFARGTAEEVLAHFQQKEVKGEIVIIVGGNQID
ncbi:MAG: 16S rRNA (cytidine(1402)-2'-O)-methyltransferase [Flavobacteriia bacterium]|nr:16S rRNA (cytidine(1402)-2'-O)-methyltransferase [Flavobacteriia bacterium]